MVWFQFVLDLFFKNLAGIGRLYQATQVLETIGCVFTEKNIDHGYLFVRRGWKMKDVIIILWLPEGGPGQGVK